VLGNTFWLIQDQLQAQVADVHQYLDRLKQFSPTIRTMIHNVMITSSLESLYSNTLLMPILLSYVVPTYASLLQGRFQPLS
jgi:hypothetical protein